MFSPISNNEREFILNNIKTNGTRDDKRTEDEYGKIYSRNREFSSLRRQKPKPRPDLRTHTPLARGGRKMPAETFGMG